MILANEIRTGAFYAGDDQPEKFMLRAEKVERLVSSYDGKPFIRLHYRWVRHQYAKAYDDEVMTTDFTKCDEEFHYHEEIYEIRELLP